MANPWHHAVSSARKWGGVPEDYLPVHEWFDETKAWCPDFRHRAIRHHSEGIFEAMKVFGTTVTLSTCAKCGRIRGSELDLATDERCLGSNPHDFMPKLIPVRWIGEQHVQEDLGHIPTAADWLRRLTAEPWMNRSRKLSRELAEM
jgi:hypothetical protein